MTDSTGWSINEHFLVESAELERRIRGMCATYAMKAANVGYVPPLGVDTYHPLDYQTEAECIIACPAYWPEYPLLWEGDNS